MIPKNKFFHLKQNSFFSITGKDKFEFIQGLISNDIFLLKKKKLFTQQCLVLRENFYLISS